MSMIPIKPKVYDDGRTKQAFKDSTDINKILKKAQKAGSISHLQKHGAYYGDFADFNFDDAQFALARARTIFEELPSQVRKDFGQNPARFFEFVNDPANAGKLADLMPELAKPGVHPAVVSQRQKVAMEASDAPSEPVTPEVPAPKVSEPPSGA